MYVKTKFGQFDRVFTSEDYGDIFAKSMGAEHWKFNQSRTIVPVSATIIRQKPIKYWDYINNFAKDYFVKKICIVGTESTGKTVLAQQLAKDFNTVWVPEMGRELVPNARTCTIDDLELVATEHAKSILKHIRLANKVLFIDTDLNITQSYSEFLFNKTLSVESWIEKANEADYYLYLDPTAPWIDDGTRLDLYARNQLNTSHWKHFSNKKNFAVFNFDNSIDRPMAYEIRYRTVLQTVEEFLSKY
jgi:HTH-type transcriptional repressor of NAD biosynthesis genes